MTSIGVCLARNCGVLFVDRASVNTSISRISAIRHIRFRVESIVLISTIRSIRIIQESGGADLLFPDVSYHSSLTTDVNPWPKPKASNWFELMSSVRQLPMMDRMSVSHSPGVRTIENSVE
jgi:hypothetical protein